MGRSSSICRLFKKATVLTRWAPGGYFIRPPWVCQDRLLALGRAGPRARPQHV